MNLDERIYQLALCMTPGIGPVSAKRLVSFCGSAGEVFRQQKKQLTKIPHIGEAIAAAVHQQGVLQRAEKELGFAEKNGITIIFYFDKAYPERLKQCYDSPVALFYRGTASLSHKRMLGIVGTRKVTPYGQALTEQLVHDLAGENVLIVSGLAYGVDILAHRAALQAGLPTIGVLAHGLDTVYPATHKSTAKKMTEHGGLLSDFPSGTKPDKENFPMRNRIVAGLCDAIVVVESGESGGSMITAEYANNYNRDVFAFPGRVGDPVSAGCHKLIKNNKAALIESAADVLSYMRWDGQKNPATKQAALALTVSAEEARVIGALEGHGNVYIDEICASAGLSAGKASALLLALEFSGVVKSLPGKFFRLN